LVGQRPVPHRGEEEIVAERRVAALELRKAGRTYRYIAAMLNVDVHTAWEDVQAELTALRQQATEIAEEVRELELRRLDDWTAALTAQAQTGRERSIDSLVRIQERRARLLGLDAPTKQEIKAEHHVTQNDLGLLSNVELAVDLAIMRRSLDEATPEDLELLNALRLDPQITALVRQQMERRTPSAGDAQPDAGRSSS